MMNSKLCTVLLGVICLAGTAFLSVHAKAVLTTCYLDSETPCLLHNLLYALALLLPLLDPVLYALFLLLLPLFKALAGILNPVLQDLDPELQILDPLLKSIGVDD